MDAKYANAYVGRAGEYRVLSELLLKGYNPSIRAIDNGIDIILDNGYTIQVKTNSQTRKFPLLNFATANYKKGKKEHNSKHLIADFVIVWLINYETFYIIPAFEISTTMLSLNRLGGKWVNYINRWDILSKGGVK